MTDWQAAKKFLSNPGGIGVKIFGFTETPSTQIPAKEAARAGEIHGAVFATDNQTTGKGRRDRTWHSEPGKDLAFSLVLRPRIEMRHMPVLNFALALAVARALERFAGAGGITLKWPNDVLAGKKKICGMICEVSAKAHMLDFAVAGIGINVNGTADETLRFPEEGREATSLLAETGTPNDLPELLGHVLSELDDTVSMIELETGRAKILEEYRARCCTIGKYVKITTEDGSFQGRATDITCSGAICVSNSFETKSFDAGDVIHAKTDI